MRKLVITENITLDGSIEMLDDWFDPEEQGNQSDLTAELRRQDQDADAFLVGRQTFTDLRSYWPHQTDDPTGIGEYLDQVQKYVVSSTLTEPEWEPTTILSGDPVEAVADLKESDGQDIVCTGSITLVHTLIGAGLVDELRLLVYPAVQGRGRRLFPDGHRAEAMALLEARVFASGVTLLRYATT
ncbi:MAG TPA: dihydrofolate reductase family protein [Marmoricola sp.]|nr:dihydrofolate reductase family protein [Marmoricola sp.]